MDVKVPVADGAVPDEVFEPNGYTIETVENRDLKVKRAHEAEVTFARYADGTVNPSVFEKDGDDGGYDVRLPDGDTVDVKSTHYHDGHLLIPDYQCSRLRADYYVLVIIPKGSDHAYLCGYATPDEILDKPTCDWNKAPCKALEQKELHPVDELTE